MATSFNLTDQTMLMGQYFSTKLLMLQSSADDTRIRRRYSFTAWRRCFVTDNQRRRSQIFIVQHVTYHLTSNRRDSAAVVLLWTLHRHNSGTDARSTHWSWWSGWWTITITMTTHSQQTFLHCLQTSHWLTCRQQQCSVCMTTSVYWSSSSLVLLFKTYRSEWCYMAVYVVRNDITVVQRAKSTQFMIYRFLYRNVFELSSESHQSRRSLHWYSIVYLNFYCCSWLNLSIFRANRFSKIFGNWRNGGFIGEMSFLLTNQQLKQHQYWSLCHMQVKSAQTENKTEIISAVSFQPIILVKWTRNKCCILLPCPDHNRQRAVFGRLCLQQRPNLTLQQCFFIAL